MGGQKPLKFHKGGLHESLGISEKKKIPAAAFQSALSGKRGELAKKEALFKKNVLVGRGK